jgi:hypothetical protein
MKKKAIVIVTSLVVVVLIGFAGYNYVMHGGGRDLSSEEASFTLSSKDISNEFAQNIDKSNKKYIEKAVAITGTISDMIGTQVIIDNSIVCNLKTADTTIKKGQKINIKGRVVGYDDLMQELKLDQCLVIKN